MVLVRSNERRALRQRWRLALVVAAVAVMATACVTDLSTEVGPDVYSHGYAISDEGVMAGSVGSGRYVRIDPGKVRVTLQAPAQGSPIPKAINGSREVLAQVSDVVAGLNYPGVWDAGGAFVDLRPYITGFGPGVIAYGVDINDDGLVVGWLYGAGHGVWAVDVKARQAVPLPQDTGGRGAVVAVNSAGIIGGYTSTGGARWTPSDSGYVLEELGRDFWVDDINDAGDMVGTNWDYAPVYWKAGAPPVVLSAAGLPPTDRFQNGLINNAGMIIFNGRGADYATTRPARWKTPDAATPELFPSDGWDQARMYDLNNKGAAIGDATPTGKPSTAVRWE
jgi:hypothetical protein